MFYFLAIFYITWLLLSMVYAFYSKALGKWGAWLRRYGWVHRWGMFTAKSTTENGFVIYFRDKDEFDETGEWQRVKISDISTFGFLLNVRERESGFYLTCLRMLEKRITADGKYSIDDPVFGFLCSVLCNLPGSDTGKERQIKVVQVSKEREARELARSEFMQIDEH